MLAMPNKALCPQPWGQRVGGVSGRPARETKRSDPFTYPRCNGGRHPGPQDADSLRGLSEERGSWSVRLGCVGLVPMQTVAPATTGVLWKNEEGNVVSVRQAHALIAETPKKRPHESRTRPSLGPETRARQSALNFLWGNSQKVSRRSRHRGWANLGNQEEPAPGS
jgi:hypothetical protein